MFLGADYVLFFVVFTGRAIEDHELVMEVQSNWGMQEENKFYFRKYYAKYEFFKNPVVSHCIISVKWCICWCCKIVFFCYTQAECKDVSVMQVKRNNWEEVYGTKKYITVLVYGGQ